MAQDLRTRPRLQLKPTVPMPDYVDGGWWPRSRQLATELPTLLAELPDPSVPLAVVGYHRDAWDSAPDSLEVGGRPVLLQSFISTAPPTVLLIGSDGRSLTLLVVPPDTTDVLGNQALREASSPVGRSVDGDADAAVHTAEQRSLDDVAARLGRLDGNTDPHRRELIARWVEEAAGQLVHAPIQAFVPILVEHIVRGRLHAASGAS